MWLSENFPRRLKQVAFLQAAYFKVALIDKRNCWKLACDDKMEAY